MHKNIILAIVVFLIVAGGGVAYTLMNGNSAGIVKNKVTLKGYVGGEKMALLEDEKVQKVLEQKYGIKLDYAKAGSIEMVQGKVAEDVDFLWPSSQVALELFKQKHPDRLQKDEIIFNSPIVLYSWDIVTEALIKEGIVEKQENSYYIIDFPKLINLVQTDAKWSDIGLTDLYGRITIISTDPSKSNSGNMFSGLLANILLGDVASDDTIEGILPEVKSFFTKLGYMEHSSSDLFEQYLRTGVGAKPIIVGYESQIIEFSIANSNMWPKIKDKVRVLYPVPTVWSSHPVIVTSDRGRVLVEAFQDEEIQKIAWESHGFRTGMIGIENNVKVLEVVGIPETINKVIPMPSAPVMDRIINEIGTIQ